MHLVKFLTIGVIFSIVLGEFGHYPFGESNFAARLTDILLGLTLGFLAIWQIGIKKEVLIPKGFFLIVLFWLVGLLSLIFAENFNGFFYLLRFILYSLSFWLGYSLIKTKIIKLNELIKYLVAIGIVLALLGFIQLLIYPDFEFLTIYGFDPHRFRLASTFLDPNFAGAFLTTILLFTFYNISSNRIIFVQTLLIISIFFTFSRSALLMLFTGVFILGVMKNRLLLLSLFLSIILIYLFVPSTSERLYSGLTIDKSARERIISWENGLYVFRQRPILGVGFNNLRQVLADKNLIKVYSEDGGHAGAGIDSSFIFLLATTGIIGFIAYLSWWFFLLKNKLIRNFTQNYAAVISTALVMSLFINSQFINSLFYTPIMFVVYLFLGAVDGLEDQGE